jgi:GMP synthase (glutamine-hydrolysing)
MTGLRPVLVIGHIQEPSLEVIARVADTHGTKLRVTRPVLGEAAPPVEKVAGVIVLGGPQSAYDEAAHPYLKAEKEYIAEAHAAAVPTLTICLGSHLAAEALGGEAYAGESGLEFGFIDVKPVSEVGEALAGRFFSFHSDTMRIPPDAQVLAVTDRYLQAWSSGSVLAIQFHPDLDRDGIETLLGVEGGKLTKFGVDVAALRRELAATPQGPGQRLLAKWFTSLGPAPAPVPPRIPSAG